MPLATTWMDLEIIILSEVSQTKIYIYICVCVCVYNDITYIWNLKK